jgi:transposase
MSLSAERIIQILKEEHPEVVARLWASMAEENERLRAAIETVANEKALREQQILNFEENIKIIRRDIFGRSREERPEASDRPRDKSQKDALLFSQAAFPSVEMHDEDKKKTNDDKWAHLPKKEIGHYLTNDELKEESKLRGIEMPSAEQWQGTSLFDVVKKVQVHERVYEIEVHKKFKHKLKPEFNDSDKDVIITAKGPDTLLPGMNYTTEFVTSVVADKYISHMPLERQTREMESLGLKGMRNSTLSRISALAAASLEPLQEMIRLELLETSLALHLDETPWKIQNKLEKDGYMWVISNKFGSYYFFKPTRSGEVIKEKLVGYDGPVVTDGFSGYNCLEETEISQGYCWAHARRQFYTLEGHDPTIKPILDDIDELFTIERRAKTFEELKVLRETESKVILMRLKNRLIEEYPKSRPSSYKRKAIEYVTKRWDGFTLFVADSRVPLSNNEAERTIRHAVMGRKNYYGSGNYSGAETAATLFTVIESCKKNDVDPRTFLLMSLKRVAADEALVTPLEYARQLRAT